MPYIGKHPSAVPVTVDDIPNNSIDASKIIDGSIQVEDVADNSITDAKLNSTKLDGIADNANKYVKPSNEAISYISGLQSALDTKTTPGVVH